MPFLSATYKPAPIPDTASPHPVCHPEHRGQLTPPFSPVGKSNKAGQEWPAFCDQIRLRHLVSIRKLQEASQKCPACGRYRKVRTVATQERGGKSPTVGRSPRRLEPCPARAGHGSNRRGLRPTVGDFRSEEHT